ncbi:MAG: glycosyltransferase family 2 protein [Stellaceae bacterium]
MLVSVIVPACAAERTIGRCIASLLAQTHKDWEAVIVADDGGDYAALLAGIGLVDPRLRFVSTGAVRSGCHNARNVGLAAAGGEIIAALDADDFYDPRRLAALVPLAAAHGAVADAVAVVSDEDGRTLYTTPSRAAAPRLSAEALLDLGAPLFPVLRRSLAVPRLAGVEYAEDVVANLRLIEMLGALPVFPHALYRYRVVPGSLCHDANSGARFEAAYSAYLTRLQSGDGFGLVATRAAALRGFARKRALNRLFIKAQRREPDLTFQHFLARDHGSPADALARLPLSPPLARRGKPELRVGDAD